MPLNGDVFQRLAPDAVDNAIEPHHLFDHCVCVWHVLQHIICAHNSRNVSELRASIPSSDTARRPAVSHQVKQSEGLTGAHRHGRKATGSKRSIAHVIASPWRLMTLACSDLSFSRICGCFCSSGRTRDRVAPVVSCPTGSPVRRQCMHNKQTAFAVELKPSRASCRCRGHQHTTVLRPDRT